MAAPDVHGPRLHSEHTRRSEVASEGLLDQYAAALVLSDFDVCDD